MARVEPSGRINIGPLLNPQKGNSVTWISYLNNQSECHQCARPRNPHHDRDEILKMVQSVRFDIGRFGMSPV